MSSPSTPKWKQLQEQAKGRYHEQQDIVPLNDEALAEKLCETAESLNKHRADCTTSMTMKQARAYMDSQAGLVSALLGYDGMHKQGAEAALRHVLGVAMHGGLLDQKAANSRVTIMRRCFDKGANQGFSCLLAAIMLFSVQSPGGQMSVTCDEDIESPKPKRKRPTKPEEVWRLPCAKTVPKNWARALRRLIAVPAP